MSNPGLKYKIIDETSYNCPSCHKLIEEDYFEAEKYIDEAWGNCQFIEEYVCKCPYCGTSI